ncbi:MAG: hypothetical protein WDO15_20235 [Bacteroidota bacterium]
MVILAVVTSAISVFYYFRIIIQMFDKEASVEPVNVSWSIAILNFVLLILMIALGLFPTFDPLFKLIRS